MQELTDISTTTGREIAIRRNLKTRTWEYEWGNATGLETQGQDPTTQLTFFHTHPRAIPNAASWISHSPGDLSALLRAYVSLKGKDSTIELISTVAGRICGGAMEVSSIAVAKGKIYVAHEVEKNKVLVDLRKILATTLPKEERITIETLTVEVNPRELIRIARNWTLSGLEENILESFRKGPP